jgi:hypothetical protein
MSTARFAAHDARPDLAGRDGSPRPRVGQSPGGGSSHLLVGPIKGKTYSLYGSATTTEPYFTVVAELVEKAVRESGDAARLLAEASRAGRSGRAARRAAMVAGPVVVRLLGEAARRLGAYFAGVGPHRTALPISDRCSATLTMTFEQYLLAAVEIELRNRLNGAVFRTCGEKVAFLPHCLRDLEASCEAKPHGLDVVCLACSDACYVNAVSRLLRRHHVRPYIWMNASLSRLLREKPTVPGGFGMLGIACIPELVAGMRRCARAGVPVVGLPLDANRCARWFGEFRPNTVNLERLEQLVAEPTSCRRKS